MEFIDPGHMVRTAEHDRGKDGIGEYIARKRRERAEREAQGIYPMPIMMRLILWSITRKWQNAQLS